MARNPFTPTFGVSPPLLVGRSDLLEDFVVAFEDGPGAPGRTTLYTGARGTGKTVMLNEVEDLARQQGWRVISETATEGLVNRLVREHLPVLLSEIDPDGSRTKVTGVSAPMGLGGATWETSEAHEGSPALRTLLTAACDLLAHNGAGLLLTLDEIHHQVVPELREVATVLQHLVREEREIASVGAGLPSAVSAVLNDDVLELRVGALLAKGRRRTTRTAYVDDVIATIPALDYDLDVAESHIELLVQVRALGKPHGAHDLIIAATAKAFDRTIVSADRSAFHDLSGIKVRGHR
ncbi:MAG: AAA family ATPase [Microthrixaceae bacterium]